MRRLLLASTLLLALPVAASAANTSASAERATWNRPEPEWREGPIRYILTDGESKEYKTLAGRGDRVAFISRFWAARDPNPFTPHNEAEEAFWERVGIADNLFTDTTISGWRTDRGRIYILLGPPDEINNYPLPSVSELDLTHLYDGLKRGSPSDIPLGQRGAVEWIYRSLPSSKAEAGQLVTFVRNETGDFVLSRRLASSFRFEWTPGLPAPGPPRLSPYTTRQSRGYSTSSPLAQANAFDSTMRSAEDLFGFGQASLFQKAEPPREPTGRVTSAQFFGVVQVQSRFDFFHGESGTGTLITLGIPSEDATPEGGQPPEVQIFGRLEKVDDSGHTYQFSTVKSGGRRVPVQTVGDSEHRLYQVRGILPPGEYRVNLGARIGDRIGTSGDRVRVPDFGGESLSLAGPVLAGAVGERAGEEEGEPFTLGMLRLVPKLEAVYRIGSDFGFYFQAYHARHDSRDGKLHLDIEYQISVRRGGLFRPLGRPVRLLDNGSPAHAYTFPLKGWVEGEYLLVVTVTDRVTGEARAGSTAFHLK